MMQSLKTALLGDLPAFTADPLAFVQEKVVGQPQPVAARFGFKTVRFLAQPSAIQHVLVTHADRYGKSQMQDRMKPLLGEGMVTASGERWHQSRTTARPSFSASGLDQGLGHALSVLQTEVGRLAGALDRSLAIPPLMGRLTLRMATAAMFHEPLDEDTSELVYQAGLAAHKRLSETMWRPIDPDALLPTRTNRAFRKVIASLEGVVERLSRNPKGLLLALQPLAERYGPKALRDEAITMLIAGFETSAMAASWLIYTLACRPDLVEWIRGEVDPLLEGGADLEAGGLRGLRRTRAVVDEVLRLYPSIWWFARVALEDDVIDGVAVPKGSMVFISPWAVQRQPDLWDQPERFDPMRFMSETTSGRFAYIPFGVGGRSCIGAHLAKAELVAIAAAITSAFDLEPLSGHVDQLRPVAGVTLAPPPVGLNVRLQMRDLTVRKVA
ncbi:Epi-isozizaene 5-monooxygenase/(E)-beta-farnesene synthase [mine drainage metagenome]|uniref:Epi-isozizaene 5-monooxygenase/(E)-beta-farnesene synthase n=1 Tax=mine drainage metagenome TaxID=410659 RepID=A0A1J5RXE1_9ZZZZ